MIRLKRLYVNTASSFCMLVIRKFLLSTEHTEDTEILVKDSRCQQNFYYPRNTRRTRKGMTDTSENRCDKISVLCRKDKFSTILARYLLYVYIIRVSSIISWTRNLKQSRILIFLIPFVDRE